MSKSRSAVRKEDDMTLEDFKEVYEDATPEKLLRLLVRNKDRPDVEASGRRIRKECENEVAT